MTSNALVNFPDGSQLVLPVVEPPLVGTDIEDGAGKRWTVSNHTVREADVRGEQIQFEVSVVEPEKSDQAIAMGGANN